MTKRRPFASTTMDIDEVQPAFAKREFLAVLIAGFGNECAPCLLYLPCLLTRPQTAAVDQRQRRRAKPETPPAGCKQTSARIRSLVAGAVWDKGYARPATASAIP